jgi:hypothetical protein
MKRSQADQSEVALVTQIQQSGQYLLSVRSNTADTAGSYQLVVAETDQLPIPLSCDGMEEYGPIDIGVQVILGRHDSINGSDNWNETMEQYVDQLAIVTALDGTDGSGCPTVYVDIDNGNWVWRIRNMTQP